MRSLPTWSQFPKMGTGRGPGGFLEELDEAKKMKAKTTAMERMIGMKFGEMEKNKLGEMNLVSNPIASVETEARKPNFAAECAILVLAEEDRYRDVISEG